MRTFLVLVFALVASATARRRGAIPLNQSLDNRWGMVIDVHNDCMVVDIHNDSKCKTIQDGS